MKTCDAGPVALSLSPRILPVTVPGVLPDVLVNENVKVSVPAEAFEDGHQADQHSQTEVPALHCKPSLSLLTN